MGSTLNLSTAHRLEIRRALYLTHSDNKLCRVAAVPLYLIMSWGGKITARLDLNRDVGRPYLPY